MKINFTTHLKLILLTAEVCSLLLPEVVRLDDVGGVDAGAEIVLEHLQDRLDRAPAGVAPHVNHHSEAQVPNILAEKTEIRRDVMKISLFLIQEKIIKLD